jgi:AraC-like DNA-binding protein
MNSRLDKISDWDERLATARWQAKALAQACGIGEWELRRYIHCKFGCGLHEWIRNKRMQEAVLLLERKLQIKNISPELGYRQVSHFSRGFKQFYGASPRAYLA